MITDQSLFATLDSRNVANTISANQFSDPEYGRVLTYDVWIADAVALARVVSSAHVAVHPTNSVFRAIFTQGPPGGLELQSMRRLPWSLMLDESCYRMCWPQHVGKVVPVAAGVHARRLFFLVCHVGGPHVLLYSSTKIETLRTAAFKYGTAHFGNAPSGMWYRTARARPSQSYEHHHIYERLQIRASKLGRAHSTSKMEKRHGSPSTAGIGLMPNTRTGDPWAGQPKYSQGMTATISIIIMLYAAASLRSRWQRSSKHGQASSSGGLTRPVAALRMLSYRHLPSYRLGLINFRLPVLGATLALGAFMLGFTIWTFVVQPYYRVDRSFGSPPLALRAGMLALGLMPFIYTLGSKVNFISLLTGVSHEKLQVYHQWLARFMLFLATVHVIPFIYQPLADSGAAGLREEFFSDSINTTGVIAYACLFVLSFASLTGIRERCYELFLLIHVPVAILFLGYMFVHCQALLTSWRYLWATAALYMLSVFLRFATQLQQNSFLWLAKCRIEAFPGGLAKMTVQSPMRWRPGQHVFVRFPGLAPLSAHPFTIISMPSADEQQLVSTVVLMAKARSGLTKHLYDRALQTQNQHVAGSSSGLDLRAVLDGPYGQDASVATYRHALFLAGGSGITFVLASLLEVSWLWQQKIAITRRVHLVWSMRDAQALDWARQHLVTIAALAPPGALKVTIYISGKIEAPRDLGLPADWETQWGTHPDDASVVSDFIRGASNLVQPEADVEKAHSDSSSASSQPDEANASAAVVVCGPTSMVKDASNAVAALQSDILRGKLAGLDSVSLITEHFGF